jgi:hypothetical protein
MTTIHEAQPPSGPADVAPGCGLYMHNDEDICRVEPEKKSRESRTEETK